MALREAFGDRKPPDITRKITACVACRKLKIKCHMDGGNPPCARCRKRQLPCAVNKSLQMLLESDVSFKEQVEQRLLSFEAAICKIAERLPCPELLDLIQLPQHADADADVENATVTAAPTDAIIASLPDEQPSQTWQVVNDPEAGPAVIPSTVVSEVSPSLTANPGEGTKDLVSVRLIPESVANACFAAYNERLDHFVYRILDTQRPLAAIRQASPLLTAAICTVGALHARPEHYSVCYHEFTRLAASQCFSKRHTLDDIRAFILGAFWLYDISWTLIGAGKITSIVVRNARLMLHSCAHCY